jgi:biopolymer transport protein ExbD
MAFSLNSSSGLRRGRSRGTPSLAEINIVPLVDVVLVLLIIFMLTAHVMEFGLQVEVPKVKPVKENIQDLPVVQISKEGTTYLNERPVNINLLADEIHNRFHAATSVYLRADRRTPFDPIAQVLATLGDAKLAVNVVTQPEDQTDKQSARHR